MGCRLCVVWCAQLNMASRVWSVHWNGVCMFLFSPALCYKQKTCTWGSFQLLTVCLCDCRWLIAPEWASDMLWNFSWVLSCRNLKTAKVNSSMFGSSMCPWVADSVAIENRMEARKCHLSSSEPLNLQHTQARVWTQMQSANAEHSSVMLGRMCKMCPYSHESLRVFSQLPPCRELLLTS